MPDHRGRTQHEQSAQIAITLFGDPTLALFAAAAVLSGHQPDPGRKVPSGVELKRVGNRGDDRRCRDRPDTGNSGEPAAGLDDAAVAIAARAGAAVAQVAGR